MRDVRLSWDGTCWTVHDIQDRYWPTVAGVWALQPGRHEVVPDGDRRAWTPPRKKKVQA